MYVNKCIKCGAEFETKNPKRVICPNCLYAESKASDNEDSGSLQSYSSEPERQELPQYDRGGYNRPQGGGGGYSRPQSGGYNRPQGGYDRSQGGYNRSQSGGGGYSRPQSSGYNRPQGGYDRSQGGYNRSQSGGGGYSRPQSGGYNRPQGGYNRPQGGFNNRRPQRPMQNREPKQLLISKEQLEVIEALYKAMLPLPNPDIHEVIGEKIGLEARKVFFGINLIRQKMMLPKLPFPKRKLAISPDQMLAIKSLYEPLLPLPPIGCHKIIAAQLKIDEWRVHVGIGLIRAQMGLDRWNQDREDAPAEFKKQAQEEAPEVPEKKTKKATRKTKKDEVVENSEDKSSTEDSVAELVEETPKKAKKTTKTTKTTKKAKDE